MIRADQINKLKAEEKFDVIIIGGGATGLGCAVDAATRGLKTLLVEKYDFAKGTSSKATKLLHGGVRYLAQRNIRLVKEALLERGRLLKNAPHVCKTIAFIVPCYSWWQKIYYGFGLWVYELLSGKLSLGKTKLLSKSKTLKLMPNINPNNLVGGILYFDGQFDDARLAVNLAATAIEYGAIVINYFSFKEFIKRENKIIGVVVKDEISGEEIQKFTEVVINATGVFADEILMLDNIRHEKTIIPSQGIHLVINANYVQDACAMMIPKTDDGRVLFTIPWYNKLVIGTTDVLCEKILADPVASDKEIDFLIEHYNRYVNKAISRKSILAVFVGLRPLAKTSHQQKTALMPRDHAIAILPSGLIHVTGGKWTTYRNIAEHTIDKVYQAFSHLQKNKCKTKHLQIHGYCQYSLNQYLSVYGANAKYIQRLIEADNSLSKKIHPNYPYTKAEVKWVIENEMAITIEDVLARRIRLLFLDANAAIECASVVAELLSDFYQYDNEKKKAEIENFVNIAKKYLIN